MIVYGSVVVFINTWINEKWNDKIQFLFPCDDRYTLCW